MIEVLSRWLAIGDGKIFEPEDRSLQRFCDASQAGRGYRHAATTMMVFASVADRFPLITLSLAESTPASAAGNSPDSFAGRNTSIDPQSTQPTIVERPAC
jgi:hypothetical protein